MQYILSKRVLGNSAQKNISEETYKNIKTSKAILLEAFSISEKYEILLKNYLDLEKEILSISAESMVSPTHEYNDFFEVRLDLNRRIINLLTTTKLYSEQVPRSVRAIIDTPESLDSTKELFSNEYDSSFEYRFMEALRNFIQHNGLSVHLTEHKASWIGEEENRRLEYKTVVYSCKDTLSLDKNFKSSVLKEMPTQVELVYSTRKYIASFSKIHSLIQEQIKRKIDDARELIDQHINEYVETSKSTATALHAYAVNNDGTDYKAIAPIPLNTEWDDVRISLQRKHKTVTNLEKRYVTNQR